MDDLVAHVANHPEKFVLKRSWEYGGKGVFIGPFVGEAGEKKRIKETFGAELDWKALVMKAAADPKGGGFVVQEYVESPRRALHYCDADGSLRTGTGFVVYSAFASIGLEGPKWGGACRASFASPVVHIAVGGGVMPLLRDDVARALLD
jgi:hypothetical protein